jgi:hypothetical protein
VVFWSERYVHVRPLHLSTQLYALSQGDLLLKLLSLCLRGDVHTTSEYHVDLSHLLITVSINLAMLTLTRFLGTVSMIYTVFMISLVSCVDFPIVLLLLHGPLAMGLKKSSLGLTSLNAYVGNCEQIGHRPGLLHGDLLHSFDIVDPIPEDIDDLDVLDVRDSVPGIAETFYVVPKTLIILLLDGLQGLSSRWMLVCTLKVPD